MTAPKTSTRVDPMPHSDADAEPEPSLEARLLALEERYCHQERLLEELSDVLYAQTRAIEKLTARLDTAERRLESMEDPSVGKATA